MKLEGEIAEIDLIERLVELWREEFTGAVRFENDGIIKIIYFKGGDVLSASTNDRADSVDEILMRANKVSREHVKQALSKRKENETLGDALLNLGFITRKELTWARRVQVIGVIRSIAGWEAGSFTIVADYLPKREEGTLFQLPQILVELIVTDNDRPKFERALEGGTTVFEKTPQFDDVFRRLGLNEDADAIAAEVDGAKSASDVATLSGRETFNVYKLLHALATLGLLRRVAAIPQATAEVSLDDYSFESAGVADAADAWDTAAPPIELDAVPPQSQPSAIPTDWSVGGPSFQLDDEQPAISFEEEEAPAPAYAPMSFDEPEPEPTLPPIPEPEPPTQKMPAWETPPTRQPAPPPIVPAPIPVAAEQEEEWGFDEAQIETARRASTPRTKETKMPPPSPSSSRKGLLLALLAVILIVGGGYAGWMWYQSRDDKPAPVQTAAVKPRPKKAKKPKKATAALTDTTGSLLPTPAATTTTATTTAPAVETIATTTTVAPPRPAPVPAPVPAATALPTVTPRRPTPAPATPAPEAGSDRYAAMAAEFAQNPSGAFTIQFAIVCEGSNVAKSMQSGGGSVWFAPISFRGRPCYRMFWGRFDTREAATAALGGVPPALRASSPVVVRIPRG